jgi:hypothetical protein
MPLCIVVYFKLILHVLQEQQCQFRMHWHKSRLNSVICSQTSVFVAGAQNVTLDFGTRPRWKSPILKMETARFAETLEGPQNSTRFDSWSWSHIHLWYILRTSLHDLISSSSSSSSCFSHLEHRASVKRFVSLQFLNLIQSVGLFGRGISPSQGRYLT